MHHRRLISILLMVAVGAFLDATVFAQEIGNATRGWKLAFRTCAGCHAVLFVARGLHRAAGLCGACAACNGQEP